MALLMLISAQKDDVDVDVVGFVDTIIPRVNTVCLSVSLVRTASTCHTNRLYIIDSVTMCFTLNPLYSTLRSDFFERVLAIVSYRTIVLLLLFIYTSFLHLS